MDIFWLIILAAIIGFCIRVGYEKIWITPIYRAIFTHIDNAIAIYKPIEHGKDFIFTSINLKVEEIEGLTKKDILYKPVTTVFPGIQQFGLLAIFREVLRTGIAQYHPITLYVDDRITGWRTNHIIRLPHHKIAAIYRDVTEEKQKEDKLLKTISVIEYTLVDILIQANVLNDDDTGEHLQRMGAFSTYLAYQASRHMEEVTEDFIKKIRLYAPLHDVGKVGLSDAILKTPHKYTPQQHKDMKQHVIIGARLLTNPLIDQIARNITLYHHERWDGSGYVSGMKGTEIPLEARIVAIADVYDALISERVYKPALSEIVALQEIEKGSGVLFDPVLVELFIQKPDILHRIHQNPLREHGSPFR